MSRRRRFIVVLLGIAFGLALLGLWGVSRAPESPPSRGARSPHAGRLLSSRGPLRGTPSLAAPVAGPLEPEVAPEAEEPPAEAIVRVQLVHPDGSPEPDARVRPDCEGARLVSRSAAELVISVPPGRCTIEGIRSDGLLVARPEPVEFTVQAGDELEVELVFPAERTGGIGVGIQEVEDGVLVTYVHPGSPAEQAGLVAGDVIVEVDGLSTAALEIEDFVAVMTGPEDTPIAFVLGGESDTGYVEEVLELVRAYLPDPRS